ncbi:hypothetical protein Tco_0687063 [Tanacetum coccineum]|uniref:Uncharacterized protein n=1 Tax=Tanacetum coccineum TaxID=301880 RepID=A0ABQ5BMZ5_9ASTR
MMKVKGLCGVMQKAMARVSHGYGLAVANTYRFIQAWIAKRKSSFGTLVKTDVWMGLLIGIWAAGVSLRLAEIGTEDTKLA